MSFILLFHHLLLNMFRMLVHPSSGACDLLWIYFMCCIALVRCVLVLRCGSAGVVWYPYAGWSTSVLSSKKWNNKTSDIKLVCLYSAIRNYVSLNCSLSDFRYRTQIIPNLNIFQLCGRRLTGDQSLECDGQWYVTVGTSWCTAVPSVYCAVMKLRTHSRQR